MQEESAALHRAAAQETGPVALAIVTVSDSRTPETDVNGHYLREEIERQGHQVAHYLLIPDDPERVLDALDASVARGARVILFNGGTGLSRRDNTFDAIESRLQKVLPGFGELFRMLSWEQVGAAAMLSRAIAGVFGQSVVVSMPGSPAAVRLAWEKLILPELAHLAWEVTR